MLTISMPLAGNDELPASRHGVIAGVLQLVAVGGQGRNDHVVVGILRKAQSEAGQLAGQT